MNTTPSAGHSPRPEPGLLDASFHDLFMDCCRLGPAPTRSRELFAIGVTAVLIGLVLVIVQPPLAAGAFAVGIAGAFMAVRWGIGTRDKWTRR
ncbi:hypothetical protein [Gordonia sp. MMO-8]|uniref:hypothetical protein n=1 Tax=Gordonia sp. MMO-8 TaxID=3127886 RepID=UPI00301AABFE